MVDYDEERLMDQITRESPYMLDMMQAAWRKMVPSPAGEDYWRLVNSLEEDPVRFQAQLVSLETAYQKQLGVAATRDRRIKELEEEIEALKKQLAMSSSGEELVHGDEKIEEMIDRLFREYEEKRNAERAGNQ